MYIDRQIHFSLLTVIYKLALSVLEPRMIVVNVHDQSYEQRSTIDRSNVWLRLSLSEDQIRI